MKVNPQTEHLKFYQINLTNLSAHRILILIIILYLYSLFQYLIQNQQFIFKDSFPIFILSLDLLDCLQHRTKI